MITNLKFANCYGFDKEVEMSLIADMRTQKFTSNITNIDSNLNILKSIALYGPNNTGKTSFIRCIHDIKYTIEGKKVSLMKNIFNNDSISYQSISFTNNNFEYCYEYKFNCNERTYVYEKMSKIKKDTHNNKSEEILFIKDTINNIYLCPSDNEFKNILNITSTNSILIHTVQADKFKILKEVEQILTTLADSIEIVDMNDIPISKTIELLKNKKNDRKKIVNFIKNADVYLDDYKYSENIKATLNNPKENEKILKNQNFIDQIKLVSVYKGKSVPSILFDSIGTKKIVALASYVLLAIENGRTIIIDELDSSLHFKITRAIFSMFNNDINNHGQLIASIHDATLLDCKKMFRKEQIWFTDKDDNGTVLYSLKDFSYEQTGVRDTSNIYDKYVKGEFGAIPDPDFISTLLEVDVNDES